MEISEILKNLEYCEPEFPRSAVAEAIARREEITPELLRILEDAIRDPVRFTDEDGFFLHIFAVFLLAKFREPKAYPLIVRIASLPGDMIFDLLGDVVTESLGSILASVSCGDTGGIKTLIENEATNEFARSAALRALVTLVATGEQSRDAVMEYFRDLFHRLERRPTYVWTDLANRCADLCPEEVQDEIEQAYEDGLIESRSIHPNDIRDAIALGKDQALKDLPRRGYCLVDDLERDMGWMSAFDRTRLRADHGRREAADSKPVEVVEAIKRSGPKIGRNDPCPCGSGKKFKKCCG